jgi:hypothetical protein
MQASVTAPAGSMPGGSTGGRFAVVSCAWALSSLVTSASFPEPIFAPLVVLTSLLLIIWPNSVQIMLALMTLVTARIFWYLPGGPNHYILEMLSCFSFVVAGGYLVAKKKLNGENLLNTAGPTVRMLLLIVYFFAVLDKLNHDYVSPHGCGWVLISTFFGGPGIAQQFPILWKVGMAGSLFMEAFLLVGLSIPRWRPATLVIGTIFHTTLAFIPHVGIASFSSLVLSGYTLFLPTSLDWSKWWIPQLKFDWPKRIGVVLAAAFGWGVISFVLAKVIAQVTLPSLVAQRVLQSESYARSIILTTILFAPLGFWMLFNLVRTLPTRQGKAIRLSVLGPPFMSFILVLALFNGMCPYLGLKTNTSFGMFSNLGTEKTNYNHFFMPQSLEVFHYQDEWIKVTSAPSRFQMGTMSGDMVPIEFKKRYARLKDGDVVEFTRNGRPGRLVKGEPATNNRDLTEPMNMFEAKFLRFRPLESGDQPCRQ